MNLMNQGLFKRRFLLFVDIIRHCGQRIKNIYRAKSDIYQTNTTISFQISKNKLRKKDIVLRFISRYKD